MGLIKFYRIFVKTYKEYNKDKIEAKKCIKDAKATLKSIKDKQEKAKLALEYLDDIYLMLPYEQRRQCVQQTMNVLKYGTGCKYGESIIKYLNRLQKTIKLSLDEMNYRYVDGEYSTIPEFYKEKIVDYIKQFKIDYLINEAYLNENK